MEAIAWGKPVIATKHAGNSELIHSILVEEKNVDELSAAIQSLLDDKSKWKSIVEENTRRLQDNFSKDNIMVFINSLEKI